MYARDVSDDELAAVEREIVQLELDVVRLRARSPFRRGFVVGVATSILGLVLAAGFLVFVLLTFRMPGG